MYLAELHGKLSKDIENKEDMLTSNVFSFFKYSNREIFLKQFLEFLDCPVTTSESETAEFYFWPTFEDGTEPDVVLVVGNYYLLFEAKYFSGFGQENEKNKHQIEREYIGGIYESSQLEKEYKLIAITADYFCYPAKYKNIPKEIKSKMVWLNWQKINQFLEFTLIDNDSISVENILFGTDLLLLLQRKRLRNYYGYGYCFKKAKRIALVDQIFFDLETIEYKDVFQGFSELLIEELGVLPEAIFFEKKGYFSYDERFNQLVEHEKSLFFGEE